MTVVMNMLMVGVVAVRMDVTVFHARCKVFQELLKKKSGEHKQTNQLDAQMLTIQLRKNMNYRDRKQIGSCEDQQEFVVCASPFWHEVDEQARKQRGKS